MRTGTKLVAFLAAALTFAAPAYAQIVNPGVQKSGTSVGNDIAQWTGTGQFLTGQGKTFTTNNPAAIRQTWNAGAVTFGALDVTVTDTASAAASSLAKFNVGATVVWNFQKSGLLTTDGVSSEFRFGNLAGAGGNGVFSAGVGVRLAQGASGIWAPTIFEVPNVTEISWSSTASGIGTADVRLFRDGAGILSQRNSTSAEKLCVYNTYTDASNYERACLDWQASANTFIISTQQAGTGAGRPISITSAGSSMAWGTNGINNWAIASGNMTPSLDRSYNFGDATHRILNLDASTVQLGFAYSAAGTALPTCNAAATGTMAQVSDATAPLYHTNYTSGGAVNSPVYCNGTNWLND